jgi:hypothetical protein
MFFPYMSTLVRGRSRTSLHVAILFGDSNRPTLFICYPGSIEKLTLLGAIYYYYYYYFYLCLKASLFWVNAFVL